jgi:NAD-dependent deacetylase
MSTIDRHALDEAISLLALSSKRAVLTGAGVSAESGVPTFRGAGGLWEGRRVEDVATPEAFARDPREVWEFYRWRLRKLAEVKPNRGHYAIARLEQKSEPFWLITQNIDGLHAAAGSRNVIEIHGTIRFARCHECHWQRDIREIIDEELPRCQKCDGLMRPAVVWFGEMLPPAALNAAHEAIEQCDLMLVCGTSGVVEPVASFSYWAKHNGAKIIEVNLERTPISSVADVSIFGKSGDILPQLIGD